MSDFTVKGWKKPSMGREELDELDEILQHLLERCWETLQPSMGSSTADDSTLLLLLIRGKLMFALWSRHLPQEERDAYRDKIAMIDGCLTNARQYEFAVLREAEQELRSNLSK